jgi:glycosyltransferase involved in cell wall biosynthesis
MVSLFDAGEKRGLKFRGKFLKESDEVSFMRIGENPTKFVRKNKEKASIPVKVPRQVTACTVTFVPNLVGYYKDGLDILRLNIAALRKNTEVPFDLMVFDNGSCPEAVSILVDLKEKNIIQWLFLSSENMKKLGAWNYLFSSVQSEYVYYFDSDIFHFSGWLEAMQQTLGSFPRAGVVGSFHNIPITNLENNLMIVERDVEIILEKGRFIAEPTWRELARSLGADEDLFVRKKSKSEQFKINRHGHQAFLGTSHCQFLARLSCLREIFPRPADWALHHTDKEFDRLLDEHGWLRLTTFATYVYHIGNVLEERWRKEAVGYDIKDLACASEKDLPPSLRTLLRLPPVKWLTLRIYALFFNLVYKIR